LVLTKNTGASEEVVSKIAKEEVENITQITQFVCVFLFILTFKFVT
jgi:hypothetical protein